MEPALVSARWALATSAQAPTMKEASARFDLEDVAPVFSRIAKLIDSGFGQAECDAVVTVVKSLKVDDEFSRAFVVKVEGVRVEFDVHAVMGPRLSPKLVVLTSPDLANRVQNEMNVYLDGRP
jgi:hypothetical protein